MRLCWAIGIYFFKYTPRTWFRWRSLVLKVFGAKIGKSLHIYPSAKVYMPWNLVVGDYCAVGESVLIYNLGVVEMGNNVTVSHKSHLCAGSHDYTITNLPLLKLPIKICSNVWICSQSFIGPNVIIKEGAVVGACSVVTNNVESWSVVAGNPAKFIKPRVMKNDL